MTKFMRFVALVMILGILPAGLAKAPAANTLAYELKFERPNTHLLDITIHAGQLQGAAVEFAMPAWAPGSYFVNTYAQLVQNFRASDASGSPLPWRKTDKQTWRIELGGTAVTVSYQIFANTLRNNWAQYNERHAFIGGPAVWMYLVGGKERPVRLKIQAPQGWRVATGMTPGDDGVFTAADYDWFADSPLEISDFVEKDFDTGGSTYHVLVHDVIGHKDFGKFFDDLQKIVAAEAAIFAPVAGAGPRHAPFQSYWFLFHVWPNAGGGLEHLNSTQINYSTDWDDKRQAGRFGPAYNEKLFVAAHEFFHAWNVKRLRPRPLGPFDYTREVYTPSLWISEGLTSYYAELVMVRAHVTEPRAYLDSIAQLITGFEQEPGRTERSIEDTSWDTWFRNPAMGSGNLTNTWYSYYDGGQIAGHLLDFAIRQQTQNQKSLDDWMRLLYQRYALPKPGFEPADAVRAASEIAGTDMSDFFRRYISGKEAPPYEKYFAYAGIRVEKKFDSKPWLGLSTRRSADGHPEIVNVIPGSPAEQGGLDRDDVIISVDRRAVDEEKFGEKVNESKPGQTLKLTVMRLGELRDLSVTLGARPYATYSLMPIENPTDLQKRIYESWLGVK